MTGVRGGRGGRLISPGSIASTASGSASVTVAIRLTQRICVGSTGSRGTPSTNGNARTATRTISASPRLVGRTKAIAFCTLSNTWRPSSTAASMLAKSSSVSTTSAASRAAAVPDSPMATPMSACLSAGASLTPSPVIATTSPRRLERAHEPQLVLGGDAREHGRLRRGVLELGRRRGRRARDR